MKKDQEKSYIKKIKSIIVAEIENPKLNGQIVGERLGISRMHLHRKLKVAMGQSISTFILQVRLEKAEELLTKTNLQVTSIAYDLGFKDASYFTRVFKKRLNCTPSQYRLMWQNGKKVAALPKPLTHSAAVKRERQSM